MYTKTAVVHMYEICFSAFFPPLQKHQDSFTFVFMTKWHLMCGCIFVSKLCKAWKIFFIYEMAWCTEVLNSNLFNATGNCKLFFIYII